MENTGTMTNAVNISSNPVFRKQTPKKFHIKDPGSAITHFIGMIMAVFASVPLLVKAANEPNRIYLISLTIYAVSLILLYAASTTYHTFDISEKVNTILKKIDHMMISVLIAGSYTPVCLLVLKGRLGIILLSIVWGGYIARNGCPLYCISEWDGPVSLHLHSFSTVCLRALSDGCWQAVSSTPSVV